MRLSELISHRNDDFKTFVDKMDAMSGDIGVPGRLLVLRQFADYLVSIGFTPIDHGVFGSVFTKPGLDYVIKVFKNDPAYKHFLDIAIREPGNPVFPKFRGKFMRIGADHYMVRMEKLERISSPKDHIVHNILGYAGSRVWDDAKTFYSRCYAAIQNGRFGSNKSKVQAILKDVYDDRWYLPTMFALKGSVDRFAIDLHGGNVMVRPRDGRIVIIDPFLDQALVSNN